jgi:hypothetical protein
MAVSKLEDSYECTKNIKKTHFITTLQTQPNLMPNIKYIYNYIFNKTAYTKHPWLTYCISMQKSSVKYFKFQCGDGNNDR